MAPENAYADSETGQPIGVSFDDDAPEIEEPEIEEPEIEEPETGEGETGEGEEGEGEEGAPAAVKFTPEQQRVFDQTIAKKTAKFREQERQLQQQLQELQSRIPREGPPEVPPRPTPWDPEEKVQAYEEALIRRAQWDAKQAEQQQSVQQQQYVQQQEAARELQKATANYAARAAKQGIKAEELKQAGEIVYNLGINDQVLLYILAEETGPSITTYLARNPDEVEKLQRMMPAQAAAYIAAEIRPKATRRRSNAPPPADGVTGTRGAREERGPKGATYE
jgi:hypothetical protein